MSKLQISENPDSNGLKPGVTRLFSGKIPIMVNVLGFVGHIVSVTILSTLPRWHKSSHKRYVNEWAWPCSKTSSFIETGTGPDLAHGPLFTYSWLNP